MVLILVVSAYLKQKTIISPFLQKSWMHNYVLNVFWQEILNTYRISRQCMFRQDCSKYHNTVTLYCSESILGYKIISNGNIAFFSLHSNYWNYFLNCWGFQKLTLNVLMLVLKAVWTTAFKTRLQLHQLDIDVQVNTCFYMWNENHLNMASKS